VHISVSSFVSSFRHEHMVTVGNIYTRMHMQDLISDFYLINYNATYDNNEVHSWPYSP
jgi:hypothetical protein